MKIIDTFVPELRSFKFVKSHELERNLDLFHDPAYLYNYFEANFDKLAYFGIYSVKEAVAQTLKEADLLDEKLIDLAEGNRSVDSLFTNLDNNEYKPKLLSKQKSKQRWLRLYAIKIEKDQYVITGGAIKLTKEMSDAKETCKELEKLERCRNYLQDNGVYDLPTFNEIILD